jgi:2-methylisocitrate lyase-like PEP mutase family enzyme
MVDADTGFGGPINAARTVQRYEQAGIAALHIEDQSTSSIRGLIRVSPKRCGHLLGKTVTSREEYASRISAACAAKSNLPSAPLIIAR